jgi:hypothetical protein
MHSPARDKPILLPSQLPSQPRPLFPFGGWEGKDVHGFGGCLDDAHAAAPDFLLSPIRLRMFFNSIMIARNPPVPFPGGPVANDVRGAPL